MSRLNKDTKTKTNQHMRPISAEEYEVMFKDYPDVMDVKDVMKALNICRSSVYSLITSKKLSYFTIGRVYRIAKISLLEYIIQSNQ